MDHIRECVLEALKARIGTDVARLVADYAIGRCCAYIDQLYSTLIVAGDRVYLTPYFLDDIDSVGRRRDDVCAMLTTEMRTSCVFEVVCLISHQNDTPYTSLLQPESPCFVCGTGTCRAIRCSVGAILRQAPVCTLCLFDMRSFAWAGKWAGHTGTYRCAAKTTVYLECDIPRPRLIHGRRQPSSLIGTI